MDLNLVDLQLQAEKMLERELAGIALIHPERALRLKIRPEIDQGAKAFFMELDHHAQEILSSDPDRAVIIACQCARNIDDFWRFFEPFQSMLALDRLETIRKDLIAARVARKSIQYYQSSGLLERAYYDG